MIHLLYCLCCALLLSIVPQKAQAALKRWDRAGVNQYTKQVAREKGWKLVAEGWCRDGDVEEIGVTYESRQPMLIPEARRVFVEEVQKAVPIIQAKQEPKTLENIGRPFTYKSLNYMLTFSDQSHQRYSAPYLSAVMLVCGYVSYHTKYEEVHEETFEEALRIVEAESRGCGEQIGTYRSFDGCTKEP